MDTVSSSESISRSELRTLVGRVDSPLMLDVRRRKPFDKSPHMVAGARYCAPDDVAKFAREHPPGEAIVYCVYGHGVGCDAARVLREAGWKARFLEGGIEGGQDGEDAPQAVAGWRSTPLPTIRKRPDLGVTGDAPSRWITRARPKIDRVACPWLIRRFIDPRAEFFYVPEAQVLAEGARLAAVPFDIDGAPISHEWERCSFDALLAAFELRDPALDALARIVRGADTANFSLAPQAAGLLAVSLGLSRMFADDHEMLDAAMPVYDALYTWCRDAQDETHTWVAHAAAAPG